MMLRRFVSLVATAGVLGAGCNSSVSIGEQETDAGSSAAEESSTSTEASTASDPSAGASASGQGTTLATTTATTTGDAATTDAPDETTGATDSDDTTGGDDDSGPGESDLTGSETTGVTGDGLVVFVNFDGPTMTAGADDATQNITQISQLATDLEPYPGSATDRAEILATVEEDFAGINIEFTDERPAAGPYTMAIVTSSSVIPGGGGIAPLDCDNSAPSSVVAAFTEPQGAPLAPAQIGATVSREVGFALGLETVDDDDAIMTGSFIVGSAFVTECTPSSGETTCSHPGCPAGSQNSFAELVARANAAP